MILLKHCKPLLASILFTLFLNNASAQTNRIWWVALDGNNANPGTFAAPLKNIQTAINAALAGDTIILKPGTYFDFAEFSRVKSLTLASQYLLTPDSNFINNTILEGNAALSNPSGLIRDLPQGGNEINSVIGLTIKNVTGKAIGMNNGVFRKLVIRNCNSDGGILMSSSRPKIDSCIFSDNGLTSAYRALFEFQHLTLKNSLVNNNRAQTYILFYRGTGTIENNRISNNFFVTGENPIFGFSFDVQSVRISNNEFIRNKGTAIYFYSDFPAYPLADSSVIVNNTFFKNSIAIGQHNDNYGIGGLRLMKVFNNIMLESRIAELSFGPSSYSKKIIFKNNLIGYNFNGFQFYTNSNTLDTSGSSDNFGANPSFADTANNNFRLSNLSVALGRGTQLLAPAFDIFRNVRPAPAGSNPEPGAHESGLESSQPITRIISITSGNKRDTIKWTHQPDTSTIRKFRLYRSISPTASTLQVDSLPRFSQTYIDTALVNGTTYYYRIRAVDNNNTELNFSNEILATPFNKAPVVAALSNEYAAISRNAKQFVALTSAGSYDPDGSIDSTLWYLNGNKFASGPSVQLYVPQGTNTIQYKVFDNDGATSTSTCTKTYYAASLTTNGNITSGLSASNSNNIIYTDVAGSSQVIRVDSLLNPNYEGGPSVTGVNNAILSSPSITPDSIMFIPNGNSLDAFYITGIPYFNSSSSLGGAVQVLPTIDTVLKRVYLGSSSGVWFAIGYANQTSVTKWTHFSSDQTSGFSSPGVITSDRKLIYTTTSGVIKGFWLDSITTSSPAPRWNFATGKLIKKALAIDAYGDVVITDDLGAVHKYRLNNNGTVTELWNKVPASSKYNTSIIIDGENNYFVGMENGKIVKLSNLTGDTLWTYSTNSLISSTPALSDYNTLYFGNQNGELFCVNSTSGQLVWKFKLDVVSAISGHLLHVGGATYFTTANTKKIYELYDKPDGVEYAFRSNQITNTTASSSQILPVWSGYQADFRRTGQSRYSTFRFIGNGDWNVPTNWASGVVPALNVPAGIKIIIDPSGNGECISNTPVNLLPGSSLTIVSGKKLVIAQ